MPAAVESEWAVNAAVIRGGLDVYLDVAPMVSSATMTLESNQVIWRCLSHIFDQGLPTVVDLPLVVATARTLGLQEFLNRPDEMRHLKACLNLHVDPGNAVKHASKIRKLEIGRTMQDQLRKSDADLEKISGDEPIAHLMGLVENPIFDLTSCLTGGLEGPAPIGEDVFEYVKHLQEHPQESVGLPTCFPRWDAAIGGGLRPGTVNVIAARPKAGKSITKNNVGLHIAGKLKLPVLDLDSEMSKRDSQHRLLARLSGINIHDIENGSFGADPDKKAMVEKCARFLASIPYDYMSIAGQPFEETLAVMRRWVCRRVGLDDNGKAKPCLIIFDYIKLMESSEISRNLSEYQALGFLMTGLHNFMVRWDARCLALAQLNRDGIRGDDTNAVSGSDRILWLCSNLTYLKKLEEDEAMEGPAIPGGGRYNRKLIPLATRHGEGMADGDYIYLNMEGGLAKMTEGPTNVEAHRGRRLLGANNGPIQA